MNVWTTCSSLECGFIHSPSDSALVHQLALRNTATDPWCGGWTLDSSSAWTCLFVIPQCTGKQGKGGAVGLFKRTTAGIFQPNGHVFTLGYFLISHCNENDKKDSFLQRSLYSRESDTITQQISQILSFILVNVCSSECWLATYCSLLPLLSFIGFTTLLLDTSL